VPAGKLGKAGNSSDAGNTLTAVLASAAVAGRTLCSFMTTDTAVTFSVNEADGWEIVAQHSSAAVSIACAVKEQAHGDARDECDWTMSAPQSRAAVIVELSDDFSSGLSVQLATNYNPGGTRGSVDLGPVTTDGNGTALACVCGGDSNDWDASGSSGPFAAWTNSFAEMASGYFHDGVENPGGGIASRAVTTGQSVSTTASAADAGQVDDVSGILVVFSALAVPTPRRLMLLGVGT
jgi:hypothetical protein